MFLRFLQKRSAQSEHHRRNYASVSSDWLGLVLLRVYDAPDGNRPKETKAMYLYFHRFRSQVYVMLSNGNKLDQDGANLSWMRGFDHRTPWSLLVPQVFTVFSTSKDHGQGKGATCGCILVDFYRLLVINRSAKYKNKYVHRRDSVSLANLTLQELQAQVDLGLVVQPDSEEDEVSSKMQERRTWCHRIFMQICSCGNAMRVFVTSVPSSCSLRN